MTRVICVNWIPRDTSSIIHPTAWIETARRKNTCAQVSLTLSQKLLLHRYFALYNIYYTTIFRCRRKRICRKFFSIYPSDVEKNERLLFLWTLSPWTSLSEQTSKSFRNRIFLSAHICHPSESVIGFPIRMSSEPERNEKNNRETASRSKLSGL